MEVGGRPHTLLAESEMQECNERPDPYHRGGGSEAARSRRRRHALRENREHMASMRSSIANMLSQCAGMEIEGRTCPPPPRPPGGARQVEDVHLQSQEAAHILDAAGI
jgi:hypothetical protein